MAGLKWFDRIPDGMFFAGACVLFAVVALAMAALVGIFSGSIWSLGDTRIFFRMADLIVQGGTPYVDFKDPKPPLLFFLLAVPVSLGAGMAGGLLLVAAANIVSAVTVMAIAWRLYGRGAGLLAGLLFAVGMAWAEGYFVLTEPFALAFILLSVYFLMFGGRHKLLTAGVCAGVAIGFKQYALLLLPLSLFYLYRRGEVKAFVSYLGAALLPLFALFAGIFLVYGTEAGLASLYWSFGMAPSYFTEGSIQDVSAYRIDDPAIAAAWVMLSLSMFLPIIVLAVASFLGRKPGPHEKLFMLAAVLFAATLVIRPFLHYWTFVLPFAVLLVSGAFDRQESRINMPWRRGTTAFATLAGAVFAISLFGAALVSGIVMEGTWRPQSIREFYGLADIVLKATARYFGHLPEPVTMHIYGGIQSITGSLLVMAGISLVSAVVVAAIAWRLYGRGPALLAGALFATGTVFALGYMLPTDALAVLLLVLSLYVLLLRFDGGSLVAGLLMGTAIVLKPLAIALILAALFLQLREGKLSKAPGFVASALVPIVLFSLFTAGGLSMGIAWDVMPHAPDITVYNVPDPLMAMLNLAAMGAFTTITVVVAVASFLTKKALPVEEYILLSLLLIFYTLCLQELTHYWFMGLPFAAVLCARLFSTDQKVIMPNAV